MEDGQYAAISGYLEHRTYPAVFTKSQKFSYITKKLQKLQAVKRQAVLATRNMEQSVIDLL